MIQLLPLSPYEWLVFASYLFAALFALFICLMMVCKAKTHKGEHYPQMVTRKTEIR